MFPKIAMLAFVLLATACSPGNSADVVDASADVPCDVFENARLCECPSGAQGISLCTGGVWAACDCNFDAGPGDTGTDARTDARADARADAPIDARTDVSTAADGGDAAAE